MRKRGIFTIFGSGALFLAAMFSNCAETGDQAEMIPFSTDFESGAAVEVQRLPDGSIGFAIPSDPGGPEYLWFNFDVPDSGGEPLQFTLLNAAGAHQTGERWSITRPVFSADGRTWVRAKEVAYSREFSLKKPLGSSVFHFKSPIMADTLHLAYCYPYTLEMLQEFIDRVQNNPFFAVSKIGVTEQGRDIPLLQIGSPSKTALQSNPEIWIICREHPGETPASFVCEGLLEALLQHPAGARLRDHFTFDILPMLNADGVVHGYYYHNARGVNLARDWDALLSAEVRSLKSALDRSSAEKKLRLVINLHSSNDPTKGHFFLEMAAAELSAIDSDLQRSLIQCADGNDPQLQGHATVQLQNLPGITGNALYKNYGVYCWYLESNYSRGADGSEVTPESLRRVGLALVQALAEVLVPE